MVKSWVLGTAELEGGQRSFPKTGFCGPPGITVGLNTSGPASAFRNLLPFKILPL